MFGDDEDAEFGEKATIREADLLKRHSAVRLHILHAMPPHALLSTMRVFFQSAADIDALVVDEGMPELERFCLLFERGQPIQRLAVMNNLPNLVADHGLCRSQAEICACPDSPLMMLTGAQACRELFVMLAEQTPAIIRAAANNDNCGAVDARRPLLAGGAPSR